MQLPRGAPPCTTAGGKTLHRLPLALPLLPGSRHRPTITQRNAVQVTGSAVQVEAPARADAVGPAKPYSSWIAPVDSAPDRTVLAGKPKPLGAHLDPIANGINFSVSSTSATAVSLCLFSEADLRQGKVTREIQLNPIVNKTGDIWHVLVTNVQESMLYGYRVAGPHQSTDTDAEGHRFDKAKVILDPYAQCIISRRRYGELGPDLDYASGDVLGLMNTWPQAAAALPSFQSPSFDWEGDKPLNLPMEQLVIYEMHVRGFTQAAQGLVSSPGTFKGMVERLDYLQALGVNAVELLPVQEFNELEYYTKIPGSEEYRFNFWGYSTVGYFAPMLRYSHAAQNGGSGQEVKDEFKTLVKECHKRGIEVILDVVFNHSAEGNELGPTLSFRGLDNRIYYMLAPGGEYYNYSGCGNTFNCNHPSVRQFIVDCLRYWVEEYHVDGFRFDLASIMTRANSSWHLPAKQALDEEGNPVGDAPPTGYMPSGAGEPTGTPLSDPPLVDAISEDPVLRNTKLIAEAWDCDGLNQVGAFPHYGGRWAEWNGTFRDVVRNFMKGTDGPWAGSFANALCGSPSLYATAEPLESDWWASNGGRKWRGNRSPTASINFITAHDGFTLADLVAYNEKHNEVNGEGNRDGENHNCSWNCGEEGPSSSWDVKRLRQRQMRNFAVALLVAHGVPMLTMGDEYGHSKDGNNNTYCHDSTLNWFDWAQAGEDSAGMLRFVRGMIQLRKQHWELQRTQYVNERDIQWHGVEPNAPDWSDTSRLVAFSINNFQGGGLYVAFNTAHVPRMLTLPRYNGCVWQPVVDSSKLAPFDCLMPDGELSVGEIVEARQASSMWTAAHAYPLLPWSCIVLEAVPEETANVQRAAAAAAS